MLYRIKSRATGGGTLNLKEIGGLHNEDRKIKKVYVPNRQTIISEIPIESDSNWSCGAYGIELRRGDKMVILRKDVEKIEEKHKTKIKKQIK